MKKNDLQSYLRDADLKVSRNTQSNDKVNDNCCYIHSKCFPSMKQGTYMQWNLMTRQAPYHIHKANYSCPAK